MNGRIHLHRNFIANFIYVLLPVCSLQHLEGLNQFNPSSAWDLGCDRKSPLMLQTITGVVRALLSFHGEKRNCQEHLIETD